LKLPLSYWNWGMGIALALELALARRQLSAIWIALRWGLWEQALRD